MQRSDTTSNEQRLLCLPSIYVGGFIHNMIQTIICNTKYAFVNCILQQFVYSVVHCRICCSMCINFLVCSVLSVKCLVLSVQSNEESMIVDDSQVM